MTERPTLLVSLLVGRADAYAHRASAWTAIRSMMDSDLPVEFDCSYHALINGGTTNPSVGSFVRDLERAGWVVYSHPDNIGIGEARNEILSRASDGGKRPFDYVMELHNDMVMPRVWAGPIRRHFESTPELAVVGAGIISSRGYFGSPALDLDLTDCDHWRELRDKVEAVAVEVGARLASATPRVRRGLSCPCIKRWKALEDVGLFYDDRFGWQEFEDTDELRRLEARGWRGVVTLDCWVYHYYRFSRIPMRDVPGHYQGESRQRFYAKYPDAKEWLEAYERDLQAMFAA